MRWLVRIGVLLLVLFLVPLAALSFYFDSAAGRAATYALGVPTSLRVFAQPLRGRISLVRLSIANPPGFERDRFLLLERGRFELRLGSLLEDRVEAPLLRLEGIELALEKRGGDTNYGAILANLKHFESDQGQAESAAAEGAGKKFVIERLEIRDVLAHVELVGPVGQGGSVDVEVPEIRLTGVGSGRGGVTLAELSNLVVKAILTAVARRGVNLPAGVANTLRSDLGGLRGVRFDVTSEVQSRGNAVQGAALERVDDAVDGAAEEAGRALRGVGGMLRRDEEK